MYYLCCENKGADQLCSKDVQLLHSLSAPLFSHVQKNYHDAAQIDLLHVSKCCENQR